MIRRKTLRAEEIVAKINDTLKFIGYLLHSIYIEKKTLDENWHMLFIKYNYVTNIMFLKNNNYYKYV